MKKMIVMAMAAAMMCGCEASVNEESEEEIEWSGVVAYQSVTFDVSNAGWEATTRGLVADGSSMTDLWLFDYVGGELVKTVHKNQDDTDFDAPTLSMKHGEHTVYFVASRGKTPAVEGTEITWAQPSDTFWKTLQLTVSSNTSNVNVTLDRVVTKFKATINDEVPDDVATLCITPSVGYYGLDYKTGSAVGQQSTERIITVPASYIGTQGQLVASIYGLSNTAEWTTDVTINAKDADGNSLGSAELQDAPFRRNMTTSASGNLFAGVRVFGLTLNDEWLDSQVIEW
jgi:hypothetical protein